MNIYVNPNSLVPSSTNTIQKDCGQLIYETHIYDGTSIPFWMLYQYQNLRYRFISKTDWQVPLDHKSKLDVDEFDQRPETTHLLVTVFDKATQQVKVVAGVRLIQTIYPYQLQNDTYADMKRGMELPISPEVVEGTRWVSKVDGSPSANITISLLMQQMYAFCEPRGIQTLIAAVPIRWEEWLNAYGIQTWGHRQTEVYEKHPEKYLVIQFPVNSVFARSGEEQRKYREATKVA